MFTFLSDIQGDSKAPFRAPPSPQTSAYFEQSGRPQIENQPGPNFPSLTNTRQQLQGSAMFTSLDGPQQFQQQQQVRAPQQQQPPNPMAENQYLRQQLMAMQQYVQQMKAQQQHTAEDTPKKSCNVLVITLMIIFLIVTLILFVFCRRLSAALPVPAAGSG